MKLQSVAVVFWLIGAALVDPSHGSGVENVPLLKRRSKKLRTQKGSKAKAGEAEPVIMAASHVDMGDDGFPSLPAVEVIRGKETNTLKSLNSGTANLANTIASTQQATEARMAKQKAQFEKKLKEQEKKSRAIVKQNEGIQTEIDGVKTKNAAIKSAAEELQETNSIMRDEFQALTEKLAVAETFVKESLENTDDSKANDLKVLKSDESGAKEDKSAPSFLALASQVEHVDAADDTDDSESSDSNDAEAIAAPDTGSLLADLEKQVVTLQAQEQQSKAELERDFKADFEAGRQRRKELLTKQHQLKETLKSLNSLQADLEAAQKHLQQTHEQLQERLRGLGLFLQRLSHLTLAPQNMAPKLIKTLPSSITLSKVPGSKEK